MVEQKSLELILHVVTIDDQTVSQISVLRDGLEDRLLKVVRLEFDIRKWLLSNY